MGGASQMMWLSAALGIAGIAALRFAWSLPKRSAGWNVAGWGLLAAACLGAATAEGAWGVAIATLAAMAGSALALTAAAATSPRGRAAAPSRRAGVVPSDGEPRRLGRRFGTLALVMGAGVVVSVGLAIAVRGAGGMLGSSEANANALALFTLPVSWGVLCTVLLMQESRRTQLLTLAAASLPFLSVFAAGAL